MSPLLADIQPNKCDIHLIEITFCVDKSPTQQAEKARKDISCYCHIYPDTKRPFTHHIVCRYTHSLNYLCTVLHSSDTVSWHSFPLQFMGHVNVQFYL
jgi:hypothetical protein